MTIIHLEIVTHLQDREIRRDAEALKREFERIGTDTGQAYVDRLSRGIQDTSPKLERALKGVADATSSLTVAQERHKNLLDKIEVATKSRTAAEEKYNAVLNKSNATAKEKTDAEEKFNQASSRSIALARQKIISEEGLARARRGLVAATRDAAVAEDDFDKKVGRGSNNVQNMTRDLKMLAGSMVGLRFAGPVGTVALAGLTAGAIDLVKILTTAAQSLFLLPAAASAAAAGIGTLKLATSGFGQAMKDVRDPEKFAADLALLGPAAQQTALELRNLLPVFDDLKKATQDTFFTGFAEQLHNLTNTFLPSVKQLTTNIAGSFNQAAMGISGDFMKPENVAQIQRIFGNIAGLFKELVPAARSFAQAFLDIAAVGSDFLPGLGTNIAEMARNFADFIRNARDSGKLKDWIQEGIDAVKLLASAIWEIGSTIVKVFGEDGHKNIETFKKDIESIKDTIDVLGGNFDSLWDKIVEGFKERWAGGAVMKASFNDLLNFFIMRINHFTSMINNLIPGTALDIPQIPMQGMAAGGSFGGTPGPGPGGTISGPGINWGGGAFGPAPPPMVGGTVGLPPYAPSAVPVPGGTGPGGTNLTPEQLTQLGVVSPEWDIAHGVTPAQTPHGGAAGSMPSGQYYGDAALLSRVPSGRYDASGDLAQGLGDCTSAIEDLVNLMDNMPTAGRSMDTGNAAEWLTARGFLPTNAPVPGAFQVGFNPEHMQATLPGGTNFNWGSNTAAAAGGVGGTGAWDPSLTSHFYRPGGMAMPGQAQGPGYYEVDQQKIIDAQSAQTREEHNLASDKLALMELQQKGNATQRQLLDAQNKIQEDETSLQKAQRELRDAQLGTWKKANESTQNQIGQQQQLGAQLDQDFGISKGLSGIAENLTKFLANLAFAPALGALSAVTGGLGTAGPGTGLLGMMAPRTNMFGQAMPNVMGQYADQNGNLLPAGMMPAIAGGGSGGMGPLPGPPPSAMGPAGLQPGGGPGGIAAMIAQQAAARGYSAHDQQAIVAYAIGESGLNPGISGGPQGGAGAGNEVIGLFQQKPGFAIAGGIDPSQRSDPAANTYAYLNQLEANRNLPIEQALPATSVGGPLSGAGAQAWPPLMAQAGNYLGIAGTGYGGTGLPPMPQQPPPRQPLGGGGLPPGIPGGVGGYKPGTNPLDVIAPAGPGYAGPGAPGVGGAPMQRPGGIGFGPGPTPPGPLTTPRAGRYPGQGLNVPQGQGIGIGGGLIGLAQSAIPQAISAAGSAADMFGGFGGGSAGGAIASAAAQIGIDEINRAIGFGAQAVGIGVQGLLETFVPNESPLADIGGGWLGRIAGGIAGVRAQSSNIAGALGQQMIQQAFAPDQGQVPPGQEGQVPPPLTPEQAAAHQGPGSPFAGAQVNNVTVNNSRATEDGTARDITHHLQASRQGPQRSAKIL